MDDEADVAAAEDGVELVFPQGGIASVAAFSQAMEFPPVIPAAGLLAKIPAEGTLVAQLGARHFGGRHAQGTVLFQYDRMSGNVGNAGQCPDPQPAVRGFTDTSQ